MKINKAILFLLVSLFSTNIFAWDHSIELGYGYSQDPNHSRYRNSGFWLNGDFYRLWSSCWSRWSLNGSLGQWHTTTPQNKHLTTGAVSLSLRAYPLKDYLDYTPYAIATAGPAVISNRQFGYNTQAKNITIQTNAGLGLEIHHTYDVNLRMEHFSNANTFKPNEGFNILYLLSFGYLF